MYTITKVNKEHLGKSSSSTMAKYLKNSISDVQLNLISSIFYKRLITAFITLFSASFAFAYSIPINLITHSIDGYVYTDAKGELRGKPHSGKRAFLFELVKRIQSQVELNEVKILNYPYSRGWRQVRNKPNTAFFNVSRTSNREGLVKWVGPLINEVTVLYESTSNPTNIKSKEQAKKVESICVLSGNSDDEFLMVNGFTNIYRHTSYNECFKLLVNGRVSLAVVDRASLPEILKVTAIAPKGIRQAAILYESNGYLAMSNDIADQVVNKWQAALKKLKRNGEYYQIQEEYLEPEL
jgi:polar amino acid transport system substrate-binding protein